MLWVGAKLGSTSACTLRFTTSQRRTSVRLHQHACKPSSSTAPQVPPVRRVAPVRGPVRRCPAPWHAAAAAGGHCPAPPWRLGGALPGAKARNALLPAAAAAAGTQAGPGQGRRQRSHNPARRERGVWGQGAARSRGSGRLAVGGRGHGERGGAEVAGAGGGAAGAESGAPASLPAGGVAAGPNVAVVAPGALRRGSTRWLDALGSAPRWHVRWLELSYTMR